MTNQEAKAIFDQISEVWRSNGNLDQAARIELARAYFTNPKFKAALEQHVWEINQEVAR